MDLAGFTVSLKMQKMDLVRDFRLARKELGIQIEALRCDGIVERILVKALPPCVGPLHSFTRGRGW